MLLIPRINDTIELRREKIQHSTRHSRVKYYLFHAKVKSIGPDAHGYIVGFKPIDKREGRYDTLLLTMTGAVVHKNIDKLEIIEFAKTDEIKIDNPQCEVVCMA